MYLGAGYAPQVIQSDLAFVFLASWWSCLWDGPRVADCTLCAGGTALDVDSKAPLDKLTRGNGLKGQTDSPDFERLVNAGDVLFLGSVSEKPVISNSLEPFRYRVKHEPPKELDCGNGFHFLLVLVRAIPVTE